MARPVGFRIGDVKRDRRRRGASTSWELTLVDDGDIFQMDVQGLAIGTDLHGVVGNLHNPENAIRRDPGIKVMDLLHWGPRTGEPEVNSYLHEGAVRLGGGCSSPAESRHRTNVVPLIDANVRDDLVGVVGIVSRQAIGVAHGHYATEIGYAMWIGVEAVKSSSNSRKELIEKRGAGCRQRNYVTTRNGYGVNLAPYWEAAHEENAKCVPEPTSDTHMTSFTWDFRDSEPRGRPRQL